MNNIGQNARKCFLYECFRLAGEKTNLKWSIKYQYTAHETALTY